jgi:hypothetical protein
MPSHSAKVLKPCLIFSNFKGDNCQKSLDCNFNLIKVREWKLKISYFSVISRGITSVKIDGPKINSNLTCAFLWHIYTCNLNPIHESKQKLREQKLKISYSFSKFKRDNSVKINEPLPNSNLSCIFLWRIYTCNFNLIHTSKLKLQSGNWKFLEEGKIIRPRPNSNMTCVILWRIHISNLN